MRIGFIILAHEHPESVGRTIEALLGGGDQHRVVLHVDSSLSGTEREEYLAAVRSRCERFETTKRTVSCSWGEWSLVDASLAGIEQLRDGGEPPDYVVLLSGSHIVLKATSQLEKFLSSNPGQDFIECVDPTVDSWVQGGPSIERFHYDFPYNFITQRDEFETHFERQVELGKRLKIPKGIRPRLGSQWWCLRWSTIDAILKLIGKRPEIVGYFQKVWIPDESFFQSLVVNVCEPGSIISLPFVLHSLTPAGRPFRFFADHADLLSRSGFFLARKACADSKGLREEMAQRISDRKVSPHAANPLQLKIERDELKTAIEQVYRIPPTPLVGHMGDRHEARFHAIERTHLLLVAQNADRDQLVPILEEIGELPDVVNLGRCFAKDRLGLPPSMLEKLGLTVASEGVRNAFMPQFLSELLGLPREKAEDETPRLHPWKIGDRLQAKSEEEIKVRPLAPGGISPNVLTLFLIDPDEDFEGWRGLLHHRHHAILIPDETLPLLLQRNWYEQKKEELGFLDIRGIDELCSFLGLLAGRGRAYTPAVERELAPASPVGAAGTEP